MKKKDFTYTTTVDLMVARMYNSKNCKGCYGKGYFVTQVPPDGTRFNKNVENHITHAYCKCVIKNMRLHG
jgi:hypothetical protein